MAENDSTRLSTFLMFSGKNLGKCREAVEFYTETFENSEIHNIEFYEEDEPHGRPGDVKLAEFSLCGVDFLAHENSMEHAFNFTPSISFYLDFNDEEALGAAAESLAEDGKVMMPLDNYGFSRKFAWVEDRFGVSWQLNLP